MSATCPGSGRKGGHFGQLLPDRIQPKKKIKNNKKIINKMQTHHSPCDIRRATWDHNALNPQDPLLPMPHGQVIVRHAVTLRGHDLTKTQCAAAGAGWLGTSRISSQSPSPRQVISNGLSKGIQGSCPEPLRRSRGAWIMLTAGDETPLKVPVLPSKSHNGTAPP